MKSILVTGLQGLVGSKFQELYHDKYTFESMDISDPENPVDITNYEQVEKAIANSKAETIIHLAAFTDVTAAWEQRNNKDGLVYQVNVVGTRNIAELAKKYHKHLIHISTAFVFDGEKETEYFEDDQPNPIEWYGQTKAEAEQVVQEVNGTWSIIRIDFPFRSDSFIKPDIARKLLSAVEKGYPLFTDHYFAPTYIDDLARVFDWVARNKQTGIWHMTTNEKISDYEFSSKLVAQHAPTLSVSKGSLDTYLETVQRPYQRNTTLNSDKLMSAIDFKLQTIDEAIAELEL